MAKKRRRRRKQKSLAGAGDSGTWLLIGATVVMVGGLALIHGYRAKT